MANMAHCRVHNTAQDLADCVNNVDAEVSKEEHKARIRLVRQCASFLRHAGIEISAKDLDDAIAEVDSWQ